MKRKWLYTGSDVIVMIAALFITISAGLQFATAQKTHAHAAYATGTVTKLSKDRPYPVYRPRCLINCRPLYYAHDPGCYVSYRFTPMNSNKMYSKTLYGISESLYSNLRLQGPIKLYYDSQEPNLNNPAGDESSPSQLAAITLISGAVFAASVVALLLIRSRI